MKHSPILIATVKQILIRNALPIPPWIVDQPVGEHDGERDGKDEDDAVPKMSETLEPR
ncbi:hypothetical protein [Methylobacterium sp. Leaf466]|uniref:hypothetical protein n=1 Tax=Methylobacterium sp. Leaf466 TaxID=1736386 RepID=UPI000B2C29B0|nr:hypothetical protein [Methylobacterium sp. Leaf466]